MNYTNRKVTICSNQFDVLIESDVEEVSLTDQKNNHLFYVKNNGRTKRAIIKKTGAKIARNKIVLYTNSHGRNIRNALN